MRARRVKGLAAAVALLGAGLGHAQTTPDAGSLLQQIEQQRQTPLPPKAPPRFVPPPPLESIGGASVTVTAFRFAGNKLLSTDELRPVVQPFLNKPLTFNELQNAATAVATAYRAAGWVVRVYLPKQDVTGGTVTIQIVEAVFGAVRHDGQAKRISAQQLRSIVETAQPVGAPVNGESLDRALLLIDDLPGVRVTGRLAEGASPGETDLVLLVQDSTLFGGDVGIDNTGSRSTGATRITANAALSSPLGLGDRASTNLLHTRGSDYARLAYSLPVGSRGLRVSADASHLSYKIVTGVTALDAHGTSDTAGVGASYPVVRTRLANLYATFALDMKRFDNRTFGGTTSKYKSSTGSLGLSGNLFDNHGGGGANSASLTLVHGSVDLDGSPNEAAIGATTRSGGSFTKLRYAIGRQQVITDTLSVFGSLTGQGASKNLDSAEKFYLGGSNGVRAYPSNEAGGAEGHLLTLEARLRLPANLNATVFYDAGSVTVNKKNEFPGAAPDNHQTLQGIGVAVGWIAPFGVSFRATLARRIGHNPNPSADGSDQDGSLKKNRVWLQASVPF